MSFRYHVHWTPHLPGINHCGGCRRYCLRVDFRDVCGGVALRFERATLHPSTVTTMGLQTVRRMLNG